MLNLSRATALATVLGCLALASPSFAAPFDNGTPTGAPNSTMTLDNSGHVIGSTPDTSEGMAPEQPAMGAHHHHMMAKETTNTSSTATPTGGDMRVHVEERIKHLHAKLAITKDQEPAFNDFAQAMRDSEANVVTLVQERHQNSSSMNAVDDLDSYQRIAQAHADGLKNVSAAFSKLYGEMSDQQKKNADVIFSTYEGHGMHHGMHKAKASKATK